MPAHHNLEAYLDAYLNAAGIRGAKKMPLFWSTLGRTKKLTTNPMARVDVYRMVRRGARDADIQTSIGCHSFRATGITAYLKNGAASSLPSRWRRMFPRALPGSTIGATRKSPSMRWNGLRFDKNNYNALLLPLLSVHQRPRHVYTDIRQALEAYQFVLYLCFAPRR